MKQENTTRKMQPRNEEGAEMIEVTLIEIPLQSRMISGKRDKCISTYSS